MGGRTLISTTDHKKIDNVLGKSMQSVILVTKATGNVSRHVVSQLLRTGAAAK
ncbi:MAG TPA: hypothetical protein VGR30_01360 [Candidatus Binatia bacterium]|nr:hypothetical protein [Candidatus Binatia bacterium]